MIKDFKGTETEHCLHIKYIEWKVFPPLPLSLHLSNSLPNAIRISFSHFYFLLYLITSLYSANPCKVWVPFICVFISTSYYLPHPTPEGSWWFLNHYQWVPTNKNKQKVIWGIRENSFTSPRQMTRVSSETKALHMAWQPLNDAGKKLDIMKHIHFKTQVGAQEGICQSTASSSPLLKKWLSQLSIISNIYAHCQ